MRITTKTFYSLLCCVMLALFSTVALAAPSPVGSWTTIDDKTQKPRSIINIWESNGVLYGKIVKVYKQPGDTGHCNNCTGSFKDKPVLGLTILWGLKQGNATTWSGGKIIDPKNGSIYRCKITVNNDGSKLDVRGYIGFSVFGRTQTWIRNK